MVTSNKMHILLSHESRYSIKVINAQQAHVSCDM